MNYAEAASRRWATRSRSLDIRRQNRRADAPRDDGTAFLVCSSVALGCFGIAMAALGADKLLR